jgi:hypothetical protein
MAMRYLTLMILLSATSLPARGEIYECVDQNGNKRFTNIVAEARGCKALNVPVAAPAPQVASAPLAKSQQRPPAVATPASFPRVDRQLQQRRDHDRRRILEQELGHEERLLAEARKDLSEESARAGNERSVQRAEPFHKRVRLHESNVLSLRREISKIR